MRHYGGGRFLRICGVPVGWWVTRNPGSVSVTIGHLQLGWSFYGPIIGWSHCADMLQWFIEQVSKTDPYPFTLTRDLRGVQTLHYENSIDPCFLDSDLEAMTERMHRGRDRLDPGQA